MTNLYLTKGALRSIKNHRSILGATIKTMALHPAQEKAIKNAIRMFGILIDGGTIHGKES